MNHLEDVVYVERRDGALQRVFASFPPPGEFGGSLTPVFCIPSNVGVTIPSISLIKKTQGCILLTEVCKLGKKIGARIEKVFLEFTDYSPKFTPIHTSTLVSFSPKWSRWIT